MFTEAFQQLAGVFSRRFFFNALLPTFVFTTLTIGVVAVSGASGTVVSAWWVGLDLLTRILFVLLYLMLVYFLSAAVASQWRNIVRVFEGYPFIAFTKRRGRTLIGQRWHRRRWEELQSEEYGDPATAYYRYPLNFDDCNVLPTRLGNILLAGERYAASRYGIDTIYFWPRLYPLLPEQFQRDYEQAIIQYQFPLVVALESTVTTVVCSVILLVAHVSIPLFLTVLLGGSAMSYAAYVLSLSSAISMAEQQRAAFDLYRDRLLSSWPAVQDVRDQKRAFLQIEQFVVWGAPNADWEEPRDNFMTRRQPDQGPE